MSDTAIAFLMFAIGFPAFWCTVYWLIAEWGGWKSLAKLYATKQQNDGEVFSWVSARLSFISNYRNCLTVSVSDAGVRVQPMLLFRFSHAPLFFPWHAIVALRETRGFLKSGTVLDVKSGEKVHPIMIYGSDPAASIARYAPARLKQIST